MKKKNYDIVAVVLYIKNIAEIYITMSEENIDDLADILSSGSEKEPDKHEKTEQTTTTIGLAKIMNKAKARGPADTPAPPTQTKK